MADLKLHYEITADDEASKIFKNAGEEAEKTEKRFEKFQEKAREFGRDMVVVGGLGVAAMKGFLDAANEAERSQAQLNAVLKSTGGVAGVSSEAALGLANSLSQVTTLSDEAILSGESMLLTFTNIGKDVFPATTTAMLDMATAMNSGATPSAEQLKSTAIQLGKALNDPSEGISALTRNGVKFTEQQQKQIEKMQKSGDLMGAQKIILDELSKEFGGSASAAAQTFSGKIEQMQNKFNELQEKLGQGLMPIFDKFIEKINQLTDWFNNLSPEQQEFISQTIAIGTAFALGVGAIALFIAAINPISIAVGGAILAFGLLSKALFDNGTTWGEFNLMVQEAWAKFVYDVNVGVDLVLWQMKRLTLASDEELKQYAKQLDESNKDEWAAYADAHNALVNLKQENQQKEKAYLEKHFAELLDIYNSSSGDQKNAVHEKMLQLVQEGKDRQVDFRRMTTAELDKTNKAAAAELEKTKQAVNKKTAEAAVVAGVNAEKVGPSIKAGLASSTAAALTWGAHFIQNFATGMGSKMGDIAAQVVTAKMEMNKIHQSYNPDIPAKLWGEHFLQNFADGMKERVPKVFEQTDEMKKALQAQFGKDGDIQKLLKDWGKDKNMGENFAQIAEQIRQHSEEIKNKFKDQKSSYDDLNQKAGESLAQLKQKHTDELKQINDKIEETKQKIKDLNDNYKINVQGVDTSVGEKVVQQQDSVAAIKKQIEDAQAALEKSQQGTGFTEESKAKAEADIAALQDKYNKESAALNDFLAKTKGLEDEISEARRRANETDFERFIEDSNKKKEQLQLEHDEKLKNLQEEQVALEDQRSKEKAIFDAKILEYEQIQTSFLKMQGVFESGLSSMQAIAEEKVAGINKLLAKLKAAMDQIGGFTAQPITGAGIPSVPGFASGAVNISQPTLAMIGEGKYSEAVVPLPDGRNIPVKMSGNSGKNVTVNLNFSGDINISKEVDQENFFKKMEERLTRAIQLQSLGSLA